MKDLATKSKEEFKLGGKEIVSAAILHITMALLGFVASRGIIFENFIFKSLWYVFNSKNDNKLSTISNNISST